MAQIEKQQFRNNTQGWIGAVAIGPKGDETGIAIEAGQTVWLSEAEQILTANAPRDPADNPFIEHVHIVVNDEGQREEVKVTPLTAENSNRFVPANERPIGADQAASSMQAASTGEEPVVPVIQQPTAASREAEVLESGETAQTPQEVAVPPMPAVPLPPAADPARVVPPDDGRVAEETAAVSPGPASEETGAALAPEGEATAGAYAPGEEVGTPTAPATPAPWSPGPGA